MKNQSGTWPVPLALRPPLYTVEEQELDDYNYKYEEFDRNPWG